MRIFELFETKGKHIAFTFGRMNPPTIGHRQVLDTLSQSEGDYLIFLSQTQDRKKNPLDYSTKLGFIKAMFPEHAKHIVEDASLNTIMKIASHLYERGYRNVTLVAGSDRIDDLTNLLNTYNGVEGKAHGYYKFDSIDAQSSGEREDGVEGVAGVSASNARAAAAAGDIRAFQEATGAGKYTQELYNAVRHGMGIADTEMSESVSDDEYAQQVARMFIQKAKIGRHNADEGTILGMLGRFFQKFSIPEALFDHVYHKILKIYNMDQPTETITRETTMKAKEFIPPSKPRNPVVRQQQTSGAGVHKDKKKSQKQGEVKHKGKMFDDADVQEISKPTLGRYVKAAGKDVEQRASSQSFASGKAGDKYNKADPTHKDTRREKGIDRALSRLTK